LKRRSGTTCSIAWDQFNQKVKWSISPPVFSIGQLCRKNTVFFVPSNEELPFSVHHLKNEVWIFCKLVVKNSHWETCLLDKTNLNLVGYGNTTRLLCFNIALNKSSTFVTGDLNIIIDITDSLTNTWSGPSSTGLWLM